MEARGAPGPALSAPGLGVGANRRQFALLVVVNAFVGAMVGTERAVLPLVAREDFGIASASVVLGFIVPFGIAKALANLAAGTWSDRAGRKPLLVAGWVAALPVGPAIVWAPSWGWVVGANVALGINQGLAWSTTLNMKVDLAGPRRRGLATGLNEVAGYGAVALTAYGTSALAAAHGPRPAPFLLATGIAVAGLVLSAWPVRETRGHAAEEARALPEEPRARLGDVLARTLWRDRRLAAVAQAGLVNNLNDALAWGLFPLYLASRGVGVEGIGLVAALYPASWALLQVVTGPWSDRVGRTPLIVGGMWIQAAAIAAFLGAGSLRAWAVAAVVMGAGTAMVYPSLLAAVGDASHPAWRATAVGAFRLVRDSGYVVGALLAGALADRFGMTAAIATVAALTAASGAVVALSARAAGASGGGASDASRSPAAAAGSGASPRG